MSVSPTRLGVWVLHTMGSDVPCSELVVEWATGLLALCLWEHLLPAHTVPTHTQHLPSSDSYWDENVVSFLRSPLSDLLFNLCIWMSLCVGVSIKVRRGSGSPGIGVISGWGLSWVLRTELGSSGRAANALNHGASLHPPFNYFCDY